MKSSFIDFLLKIKVCEHSHILLYCKPGNLPQYYFPFNNRKAKVEQDQIQQIKYSFFLCQEDVKDDDADDAR